MAEQLELFGDFGKGQHPGRDAKPGSQYPHHSPTTPVEKQREVPPEGYVWVRIGPDAELTCEARALAEGLGLSKLVESISVSWNKRMRTAAGRAFYQTGRIELNPKLQTLPEEIRDAEIRATFLHELAHLVSFARHRGKRIQPHGDEWKQACVDLGIAGENRCHDLNFQPRRQKRKYAYECPACGSVVKRVRRLKRKVACYDCCREKSGGLFDARFVLRERKLA